MNFDLSEDEEMLKALAERFVNETYDVDRRRAYQREATGFSVDNWRLLGELGLIAALFDEASGGLDLDATGIATVFEALGRGLVVEPLIENGLFAGRLFAAIAPPALRDAWLSSLITGERRLAVAHAEAGGRAGMPWVETRAEVAADGAVLTGAKAYVPAGAGADAYLVTARERGNPGDSASVRLFLVPADAPGLVISDWRMADGSAAVSLRLETVRVPSDRILSGGVAAIDDATIFANLARAAEALGIMERLFAETQDYLRTREQFGSPLSSFQAIQHRMVAQYAAIEQARALLNLAMVARGDVAFADAVRGVRAFVSDASLTLAHEMVQFHGGMGVTDELSIGHGHKRLLVLSRWPDEPEAALDRFAGIAA